VHTQLELDYLIDLADDIATVKQLMIDTVSTQTYHLQANELRKQQQQQSEEDQEEEEQQQQGTRKLTIIPSYHCYKNLAHSILLFKRLASQNRNPALDITITDIGDSWTKSRNANEGHDIWALRVTGNGVSMAGRTTEKGILYVQSGLHAREFAPPELVRRWITALIDDYGEDGDVTSLLDHTEIHIVLQTNPDAREVVERNPSEFRRKNMNTNRGNENSCGAGSFGVDLNRNFPFKYGSSSSSLSNSPCSPIFRGDYAASEPEIRAIVDYCTSIFPASQRQANPEQQIDNPVQQNINGIFVDVHSYGSLMGHPWFFQHRSSPNNVDMVQLTDKIRHHNGYGVWGQTSGYTYTASGTSVDWAYGVLGTAAILFEVGDSFYQNCNEFNENILGSNAKALNYAAKVSRRPFQLSKGPDIIEHHINGFNQALQYDIIASDSDWASSSSSTDAQQGVNHIKAYINEHPDDATNGIFPEGIILPLTNTYGYYGAKGLIDISSLPFGQHTMYIQATDTSGFAGPVTAVYFTRTTISYRGTTSAPSPIPTQSPVIQPTTKPQSTRSPTVVPPTFSPTPRPSRSPTKGPTKLSTRSPSSQPSEYPSGKPSEATLNPSTTTSALPSLSTTPSLFPTLVPSIVTSSPSRDYICDDSRTGERVFINETIGAVPCHWISARPSEKARICDPAHPSDAYSVCEETCDKCIDSCEDDPDALFEFRDILRNCAWLSLRHHLLEEACVEEIALLACPETCNVEGCELLGMDNDTHQHQ